MLRFAEPQMLFLLALIPLIMVVQISTTKLMRRRLQKVFGVEHLSFFTGNKSIVKSRLKKILQHLFIFFAVIALARPQAGQKQTEVKSEGIELVIAIDVSNSMLADDLKPNRLAVAQREAMRLLDLLVGDRVGILAFAGSAVLLSPMTPDKAALKMFVESLSTEAVTNQGTNFTKALEEAQDAFDRGGVETGGESRVTRAVLFISDGEDQEKGALAKAEELVKKGIRIFTIAMGTEQGAPIPVKDPQGNVLGYKRDNQNQVIMSQTRGEFLQQLAKAGQGSFYHYSYSGEAIEHVREDLNRLEKSEFDALLSTEYDELYQIFLVLGLACLAINFLLGDRRRRSRVWKGRFDAAIIVLCLGLISHSEIASAQNNPLTIYENNKSLDLLKDKKGFEAQKAMAEALANDPFNPVMQFNLGVLFEVNQEPEKALKVYQTLTQESVPEIIKFQAHFNAGRIMGEEKKYDEALEHYQKALDIVPQSKETKTNIELLISQQQGEQSKDQKGQGGGDSDKKEKQQSGGQDDKEKKDQQQDQKDEKDQKDPKDQKDQEKNQQGSKQDQSKKKPKPFDAKDLSEKEVEKILEELKRQEQNIRAKFQSTDQKVKESPNGKDW